MILEGVLLADISDCIPATVEEADTGMLGVVVDTVFGDAPVGLLTPQLYKNNDKLNKIIKLIDATRADFRYLVMGAFRF